MISLSKSTALVWIKGILALSSTDSTITAFFCNEMVNIRGKKLCISYLIVPIAVHFFGSISCKFFPLFLDTIMGANEFQ